MKHYFKAVTTPILDIDLEAGDTYLAELAHRASVARYDHTHGDAVLDWVN